MPLARRTVCGLTLLLSLAAAPAAWAGSASTTFAVSATVVDACIVTALPLAFGNYDGTSAAAVTGSTTLTVTCTLGASYSVGLGAGTGTGANPAGGAQGRLLTRVGGGTLGYNLYQDSAFATAFGVNTGQTLAGTGTGLPSTVTVYGRIPGSQASVTGVYADTINVVVNF